MPGPDRYASLPTEAVNAGLEGLDRWSAKKLVAVIHRHDQEALRAVGQQRQAIARCVEIVAASLAGGGRLIYLGAGTSGRLAALDAAECPPTFGTPPSQILAVVAGGSRALRRAVEGAEDQRLPARQQLRRLGVKEPDVVCGISASGATPFVRAGLDEARRRAAITIMVTCAPPGSVASLRLDQLICLDVGSETIAGSTRMKSGLATKAVLHTLTTAAMVRLGKVHDNLMVDLRPTSAKLRKRACRIVQQLTGLSAGAAGRLLKRAGDRPKVAAVMHWQQLDVAQARRLLARHGDRLRPLMPQEG